MILLQVFSTFFIDLVECSSNTFHNFLMILLYILLKMGASVDTFLSGVVPGQPFLLCVGAKKNSIQRYFVIIDHKAIPYKTQTSLAAFDELFFTFSVN